VDLPLAERRLIYRCRSVASYAPVYPGIVFIFANELEKHFCFGTRRVASIVLIANQDQFHAELRKQADGFAFEIADSWLPHADATRLGVQAIVPGAVTFRSVRATNRKMLNA